MRATKFLRPKDERTRVAKPFGGYLAPEGERVPWNTYWRRRHADGDVVEQETTVRQPELAAEIEALAKKKHKKTGA